MITKRIRKGRELPIGVKATFWFLLCSFLQKGISVLSTPIFTRLLTTAEYGQYNIFYSWMNILTVFVTLNLYSGVYMQGIIKFEEQRDEFTSSMMGLMTTLTLAWIVMYCAFHEFWNQILSLTNIQMFSMLIMLWTTGIFNFWSMEQRVDLNYKPLVSVTLFVSLAKPLLGIVLVMHSTDKVTARIVGLLLVEIMSYTWMYVKQMRKGGKFFSWNFWVYAARFNLPLIPHYLSLNILSGADRIMIGKMIGKSEAGIYGLAYSVSQIMTLFNVALLRTVEPWLYKKIKLKEIREMERIVYPLFVAVALLNLLLIALAPEIVSIFAPYEYRNAIWIIPPVAMSVYFMFAYSFFAAFEFYYEKTRYIAVATILGAILNIILNYVFMDIFGYYAAGYTTLICYMVYAGFHYYFMKKICRLNLNGQGYKTKMILGITFLFMLGGFGLLLTYNHLFIRYGVLGLGIIFFARKYPTIRSFLKTILEIREKEAEHNMEG